MGTAAEELSCISIILCDDILRDEDTKKLVLVGTFNEITASRIPFQHPRMKALFTLTNGNGEYDLSLCIEHEASGEEVVSVRGPFRIDNPLAIVDVNVGFEGVAFSEAGKHWLVIRSDGRVLQQRPFLVRITESTGGEENA